MKSTFKFLMASLLFYYGTAQELSIDADIRPRAEYSHGFGNLIPSGADAALFVQQRSRLKIGYTSELFSTYVSFQDVSVWGDTPQIAAADGNDSFSLAQAWIKFKLGAGWSTKIGRQALSYDDQRILGGLDWAMQGRFHDAALLQYKNDSGLKLDVGVSFNQNGPSRVNTLFDPNNAGNARAVFDYKSMAYAWLHKDWDKISGSLLFVNNTYQNLEDQTPVDGTVSRQTFGTHLDIKPSKGLKASVNAFLQTGKFTEDVDLFAYNLAAEITYKPAKTLYGIGAEILSGDSNGGSDGDIESFFPLFGTNHKFNGFMDYFYVGEHANSVGLQDLYAKTVIKTSAKSSLLAKLHYFVAAEDIATVDDKYLGTEIDLVYTRKLLPFATLKVGYSHMFAADDVFEALRADSDVVNPSGLQNWAWAMIVVKPNLLKWSPKK